MAPASPAAVPRAAAAEGDVASAAAAALERLLAALPPLEVPRAHGAVVGKRVAVVGGSIGGLAAAACLRAAGFADVQVFERLESRAAGAGVALDDAALAVLTGLGLRPAGVLQPMRLTEERMAGGQVLHRQPYPCCSVLYAKLQSLLAERLPVNTVHFGRRVLHTETSADGSMLLHFDAGAPVPCDLVVAADGPNSAIRAQLFPESTSLRYAGYFAWRGLIHANELPGRTQMALQAEFPDLGNCIYFVWLPEQGQSAVLYDIGGGLLNWLVYETRAEPIASEGRTTATAHSADVEGLRRSARHFWGEALGGLIEATHKPFVNDIYDLQEPLAELGRGGVVLFGDAAHPTTPHMAKGSNLALHDAFALATAASGAQDVASMVAAFSRSRAQECARCVLFARQLGRLRNGMLPAGRRDFEASVRSWRIPTCTLPSGTIFKPVLDFTRGEVDESQRGVFLDLGADRTELHAMGRAQANNGTARRAASGAPPLRVTAVNHVSRETNDVERLRRFYEDVLGFRPLPRPDFGFGGAWLEIQPGLSLHIIERDPTKPSARSPVQDADLTDGGRVEERFIRRSHHVALTVYDIEAAKSALEAHGIRYACNVVPGTPVVQLFFHDPDGNGVEIGNFDDMQLAKL